MWDDEGSGRVERMETDKIAKRVYLGKCVEKLLSRSVKEEVD